MQQKENMKLAELINDIYKFSVDYGANSMVSMHLHQAFLHLEKEIREKQGLYPLPVKVALTEGEFVAFVTEILLPKPYPYNSNQQKGN